MIRIVDKLMHAGEGRRLKALEEQVRAVNTFEPQMQALGDAELAALTLAYRERAGNGEPLEDLMNEAFAAAREAARRALEMRPFDVQVMGATILFEGDIAEMKTGEGKTLVATMPMYLRALARARRPPRHRQRLPGAARRRVDGPGLPLPRPRGRRHPGDDAPGRATPRLRRRRDLRHQQRVRLRLPARQHDHAPRAPGAARPLLLHRRRGRLDPHRRGAHPAHHQRRAGDRRRHVPALRARRPAASPRRRLRGRREAQDRGHHRERRGQDRAGARHREPLQGRQPRQPPDPGVARPGALQEGRRLRDPGRRGQDRRRVHRSHHGGPALVRGSAPGDRGQGARADPRGEPDPRHDHPAELLPHVRAARGHDRYGQDRGGRVPPDLRPRGGHDPHQRRHGARRPQRLHLQDPQGEVRGRRRRPGRALRAGSAGARRHGVGRGQRAALAPARAPRRAARRAQREEPRP